MTLLQLQARRDKALASVASAKNETSRTKAAAELDAATMALATFKAKLDSKTVKETRTTREETTDEDEEEEEEESEEEEDDEPKKPLEDDEDEEEDEEESDDDEDDDSDDDDDADNDEDEEEEEDEEEKAEASAKSAALASARTSLRVAKKLKAPKAVAAARASLRATKAAVTSTSSHAALRAAVQKVTGKKSLRAMLGALEGLAASAKKTEELSARVAKSERRARRQDVNLMLKAARQEGRVSKGEVEGLRADAMKMGTKWLKSHLGARPKLVRSTTDGGLEGRTLDGGKDGDGPAAALLDAQNLPADQRLMIESAAAGSGKSVDEFVAEMNKKTKSMTARARRGA